MLLPSVLIFSIQLSLFTFAVNSFPKQLTFELPDRDTLCFYEEFEKNEDITFVFQVLRGGENDVDIIISDPNKKEITKKPHTGHETFNLKAPIDGQYAFCFGNQFSSISHKVIFFQLSGKDSLREEAGLEVNPGPENLIETLTEQIHDHLNTAETHQSDLRAKKLSDRLFALDLIDHTTLWSAVVSCIIIVTVITQVTVLKSFFKDKKNLYTPLNSGLR